MTDSERSDSERGLAILGAAHRERDEYQERELALEEMVCERFNPRDDDSATTETIIEEAADFIEAQPCACTPEMIEDYDSCPRCSVLGRLGNKPVQR